MKMMLKEFKISCNNLKEDRNVSKNLILMNITKQLEESLVVLEFAGY